MRGQAGPRPAMPVSRPRDRRAHTVKAFASQVAGSVSDPGGGAKPKLNFLGNEVDPFLVELCGIVVWVTEKEKYVTFGVDDSTSVAQCLVWRPASAAEAQVAKRAKWSREETQALEEVARDRHGRLLNSELVLGAQVKVRGRVDSYLGRAQVKVASVCKVDDPNAETEHRMDAERLYRDVYTK